MPDEHPLHEVVEFEARRVLRELPSGSYELPDLMNYGYLGLLEAEKRFDSSHGNLLSTFARHRIRGSILDGIRHGLGPYGRRHYEALRSRCVAELNASRTSSDDSIIPRVDKTDVTLKQVNDLAETLLNDHPAMPTHSDAEEMIEWDQELQVMRQALEELQTEDRTVIRAVYDLSLKDDCGSKLADRLGVHRSKVSRRHKKIMPILRAVMRRIRKKTIDVDD